MWLGHMSHNGMQKLSQKHIIHVLNSSNFNVCTHCLTLKQHIVDFKKDSPSRNANVLDLVRIDICSMDAMSLGGV